MVLNKKLFALVTNRLENNLYLQLTEAQTAVGKKSTGLTDIL